MKNKVDFHCRVEIHFVDPNLIVAKPDGSFVFSYRSIAMKNLEHIECCNYMSQAYGIMADFWNATHKEKITTDELIGIVKQTMKQN